VHREIVPDIKGGKMFRLVDQHQSKKAQTKMGQRTSKKTPRQLTSELPQDLETKGGDGTGKIEGSRTRKKEEEFEA